MDLSIVIPAYNEANKIARDIESADRFLSYQAIEGEIIIADDGSSDNTVDIARQTATQTANPVIIATDRGHHGKGFALRQGFSQTTGQFAAFADSGMCVPYEEILCGIEMIQSGQCDIAHGSRKIDRKRIARQQSFYRRVCSELFRSFVHKAMGIPSQLTDTQCGFKIYRGQIAREIYGACITDGFMIDIEVILRALKCGYTIKEFVIDWTCDPDSRVKPAHESLKIINELNKIRRAVNRTS